MVKAKHVRIKDMVLCKPPGTLKSICISKIAGNIWVATHRLALHPLFAVVDDIKILKSYLYDVSASAYLVYEKYLQWEPSVSLGYIVLIFGDYLKNLTVHGADVDTLISLSNTLYFKNLRSLRLDTSDLIGYHVEQVNLTLFLESIPCFQFLTRLCTNYCTDKLLKAVGQCCPKLQIFDCRADRTREVTDAGLCFLSACSNLTTICFNADHDYYSLIKDGYFSLTGLGIAHLIMALPELTHLDCEEQLLQEAVWQLLQFHGLRMQYKLRNYHFCAMRCREGDRAKYLHTLRFAVCLFPNLNSVSIGHPDRPTFKALATMSQMTHLTLVKAFWKKQLSASLSVIGANLKVLHLLRTVLTTDGIHDLALYCTSLTELVINSSYQNNMDERKLSSFPVLQNLKVLSLSGELTEGMVLYFVSSPNLLSLEIEPGSADFLQDDLLYKLLDAKLLSNLHKFWLRNCDNVSVGPFRRALNDCPNLKVIGDLANSGSLPKFVLLKEILHSNWDLEIGTSKLFL